MMGVWVFDVYRMYFTMGIAFLFQDLENFSFRLFIVCYIFGKDKLFNNISQSSLHHIFCRCTLQWWCPPIIYVFEVFFYL